MLIFNLIMNTVIKFFHYRRALKANDFEVDRLTLLDLNTLKQKNIVALILDFDGVLGYQGDLQPLPEVIEWLERTIQIFGSKKIFILSNKPLLARKQFFDKYFNNNIIFIIAKPKPDTQGITNIFNILQQTNIPIKKTQVLMIDDRFATGILAAKIFGIPSCLIKQPYVNLKQRFFEELFFIVLRKIERLILWRL